MRAVTHWFCRSYACSAVRSSSVFNTACGMPPADAMLVGVAGQHGAATIRDWPGLERAVAVRVGVVP